MVLLLSCRDSPSESLRFASAPELACDEILDMVIQHLGRARPHLDAADEVERELEGRVYATLAEMAREVLFGEKCKMRPARRGRYSKSLVCNGDARITAVCLARRWLIPARLQFF